MSRSALCCPPQEPLSSRSGGPEIYQDGTHRISHARAKSKPSAGKDRPPDDRGLDDNVQESLGYVEAQSMLPLFQSFCVGALVLFFEAPQFASSHQAPPPHPPLGYFKLDRSLGPLLSCIVHQELLCSNILRSLSILPRNTRDPCSRQILRKLPKTLRSMGLAFGAHRSRFLSKPFPKEEWERLREADKLGFAVVVSLHHSLVRTLKLVLSLNSLLDSLPSRLPFPC